MSEVKSLINHSPLFYMRGAMSSFLHHVVRDLLIDRSSESEHLSVVMPSRRARTFFTAATSDIISDRPVWQPHMLSIDDMMSSVSSLVVADRFRLIAELYKVYFNYHKEDFDHFYHWGDLMVRDFDTIDNYMVNADLLFANISDIKEIDAQFSVEFSSSQLEAIRSFWKGYLSCKKDSNEKGRFITIWNTLSKIYTEYKQRLEELGIGYKGMIYRKAAEKLKGAAKGEYFAQGRYAVVGFNALSASEKELLRYLKLSGDTLFYWDVDSHFIDNPTEESAQFIRENISLFGQDLDMKYCNNYRGTKDIRVVEAPSSSIQCRYAADFLKDESSSGALTAVVLTDESLLLPLLYSMPNNLGEFNVTLGYDLKNTPAYTLVEYLIRLQQQKRITSDDDKRVRFYRRDIEAIVEHAYLSDIVSENLKKAVQSSKSSFFMPEVEDDAIFAQIFTPIYDRMHMQEYLESILERVLVLMNDRLAEEALSLSLETVIKVSGVIAQCNIDISLHIYYSLLRKHLASIELAFIGEPLIGTQIMGILESRIIDFERVIILSTSEDHFPGRLSDNSFVPYNLKRGFGLPTLSDHEAMYSYYFYRLLYRAKRVDIVYSSSAEGISTGEASRYIRQLEYDLTHSIKRQMIDISIKGATEERESLREKSSDDMVVLDRYLKGEVSLSPSSLFRYIECPYMFFLHDISGIKVFEEMDEQIDAAGFGTAMHHALEMIYKNYDRSNLDRVSSSVIESYVDESLLKQLSLDRADFRGGVLSMRSFIVEYVKSVVAYDSKRSTDFKVISNEQKLSAKINFKLGDWDHSVRVSGMVDRIDELPSGVVRIIDYKSGSVGKQLTIPSIESLFDVGGKSVVKPPFQALLYSMMYGISKGGRSLPALYFARNMRDVKYTPYISIGKEQICNYSAVSEAFESNLKSVLSDLFSKDVPFKKSDDRHRCSYCNLRTICGR